MSAEGSRASARILVVEDDRTLRRALELTLSAGGWSVAVAENGQHGLTQLAATDPDAVVLDVGLPDIDGVALCRRLRKAGNRVPVLMVSADDDVEHRIHGLDAGADDYLGKPVDIGELRARLRALLRRVGAESATAEPRVGELRLERERHGVRVGDACVDLSPLELQLLELLMRNPGTVLPPP